MRKSGTVIVLGTVRQDPASSMAGMLLAMTACNDRAVLTGPRFPALQHMQVTPTSTPRGTQSEGSNNPIPAQNPLGPPKGRLVVNIIAGRNIHTPSHEVSFKLGVGGLCGLR